MSDPQTTAPMAPTNPPRAYGAFSFATFMRSGFSPGDEEMVAKKFEALAAEIERLRAVQIAAQNYIASHTGDHMGALVAAIYAANVRR